MLEFYELLSRASTIASEACRLSHQQPKLEDLKAVAQKGQRVVGDMYRLELEKVHDLVEVFTQAKDSDYDFLGVNPQPVHEKYLSVDDFLHIGKLAQAPFDATMLKLCTNLNMAPADLIVAPLKNQSRLTDKLVELKQNGKHEFAVFDINRATLTLSPDHRGTSSQVFVRLPQSFELQKFKK